MKNFEVKVMFSGGFITSFETETPEEAIELAREDLEYWSTLDILDMLGEPEITIESEEDIDYEDEDEDD